MRQNLFIWLISLLVCLIPSFASNMGEFKSWALLANNPSLKRSFKEFMLKPIELESFSKIKGILSKTDIYALDVKNCSLGKTKPTFEIQIAQSAIVTRYDGITCDLTFHFNDVNYFFFQKIGKGRVRVKTSHIYVRKTYLLHRGKPAILVNVNFEIHPLRKLRLRAFDKKENISNFTRLEVKNALTTVLRPILKEKLIFGIQRQLQKHASAVAMKYHSHYHYVFDKTYSVKIDRSIEDFVPTEHGLLFALKGDISGQRLTGVLPRLDVTLAPSQGVLTQQFVANMGNFAAGRHYYDRMITSHDIEVPGLDFVISDLFFLNPDLRVRYHADEKIYYSCRLASSPQFELFREAERGQGVKGSSTYSCNARVISSSEQVLSLVIGVEFKVVLNITEQGILKARLEKMSSVGDVEAKGMTLDSDQQFVLNAYVKEALTAFKDIRVWGDGLETIEGDDIEVRVMDNYILVLAK
eukprot:TRINITY_DN16476_c0_g1_i1.p1 TRINITY_DN16476_c0_g1~~TRINITY_DN16476_c0_g1_i1.p1  ORF type:complete len:468 (-),score=46.42 TRINITY_DN16476_c0_g1_i1:206-1609(-)